MEYELYHHGILGQKWGKRNGPPYPLSSSDHSKSEQRAGWKKSLSNSSKVDNNSHSSYNSNTSKEKHQLTDNQKKALKIGAAVVGTALVTAGAVYAVKSGKAEKLIAAAKPKVDSILAKYGGLSIGDGAKGIIGKDNQPLLYNGFPKIEGFPDKLTEGWIRGDLKNVNPLNGDSNCVSCSVATYLRSLGYDVVSKVRDSSLLNGTFSIGEVVSVFPDFDWSPIKTTSTRPSIAAEEIKRKLLSHGEGAAGIIGGEFSEQYKALKRLDHPDWNLGGHMFSWRVLNGQLLVMDGQNNIMDQSFIEMMLWSCDSDKFRYGILSGLDIDMDMVDILVQPR